MRIAPLLLLVPCLWPLVARAEGVLPTVETPSAVVAVLLHPDAAIVTREATVTLPDGAATVVFAGVPANLAQDSLRASGEAANELSIGAVETRVRPAARKPPEGSAAARLKDLRAARASLDVAMDALRAKLEMIKLYAQAGPDKAGNELRFLGPGDWATAFKAVGGGLTEAGEELRVATAKAQDLDAEIAGLVASGGAALPAASRDVTVGVVSHGGGPAKLRLVYRTDAGFWRPAYAARLDTGDKTRKPALELQSRAVVTQRSGEDWKDAALTVSTLRARRSASAPEVVPERVAFVETPPIALAAPAPAARPQIAMQRSRGDPGYGVGGAQDGIVEYAAKKALSATEAVAEVEPSGYAATFKIAGPAGVPGDGTPKTFLLSTRHVEPKLAIRAAPALDPQAYLEARLVNEDEAPLLPGQMSVERDGVLVGAQQIALLAPGDARDFGFGVDDKLKITRAPVKRKENEPTWFGQTKTETREFKTVVKNLHDFAMHATIVDRAPFSENTAITVETLPQTTPPTEKQPEDKRGVLAWSFALAPGETKEILLAYRIKWPAEREIVFEPAPAGR